MLGGTILRLAPAVFFWLTVFFSDVPFGNGNTAVWNESWTKSYELIGGEALSEEEIAEVIYDLQSNAYMISAEASVPRHGSSAEGNPIIRISLPGAEEEAFGALEVSCSLAFISARGEPEEKLWLDETAIAGAEAVVLDHMGIPDYSVRLTFTEEGSLRFAEATRELTGEYLYIVYNGECISAPVVNAVITGGVAMISGLSSEREADRMAALLRLSAMDIELREIPKG